MVLRADTRAYCSNSTGRKLTSGICFPREHRSSSANTTCCGVDVTCNSGNAKSRSPTSSATCWLSENNSCMSASPYSPPPDECGKQPLSSFSQECRKGWPQENWTNGVLAEPPTMAIKACNNGPPWGGITRAHSVIGTHRALMGCGRLPQLRQIVEQPYMRPIFGRHPQTRFLWRNPRDFCKTTNHQNEKRCGWLGCTRTTKMVTHLKQDRDFVANLCPSNKNLASDSAEIQNPFPISFLRTFGIE